MTHLLSSCVGTLVACLLFLSTMGTLSAQQTRVMSPHRIELTTNRSDAVTIKLAATQEGSQITLQRGSWTQSETVGTKAKELLIEGSGSKIEIIGSVSTLTCTAGGITSCVANQEQETHPLKKLILSQNEITTFSVASFKPTVTYPVEPTVSHMTLSSSKTIGSRMNVFINSDTPFAIDRGDGLTLTYNGGEYGFGDQKPLPVVVAGDSIRIIGGTITKFGVQNGDLKAVNLPKDNPIKYLNLAKNHLSILDLSSSLHLEHLVVSDNALRALDVTCCPKLRYLSAYFNFLDELHVSGLKKLEVLYINHSKIKQVDLTGCTSLVQLWMCDNAINKLVMPEKYDNLRALFMRNTRLSIPEIETILSKLPDVSHEEITADNAVWMRQLKLERTPGIEQVHLAGVIAKGWIPDIKGIDAGVESLTNAHGCKVYPTISSGLLYVERCGETSSCNYQIVSVQGEVIATGLLQHATEVLPIDDLPQASYYLVLKERGESYPFVRE